MAMVTMRVCVHVCVCVCERGCVLPPAQGGPNKQRPFGMPADQIAGLFVSYYAYFKVGSDKHTRIVLSCSDLTVKANSRE
eukprot:7109608-Pyramimonas_sp.AAC.1